MNHMGQLRPQGLTYLTDMTSDCFDFEPAKLLENG
jgi:hypothetical protein